MRVSRGRLANQGSRNFSPRNNAFKHAFVGDEAAGLVVVAYEATETQ